ncbi:MAG: hypothetical protein ACOZEN_12925 [Thermodesulfobacteriota bacterium]
MPARANEARKRSRITLDGLRAVPDLTGNQKPYLAMSKKNEQDWLFMRQYDAVHDEHPDWPEEKKVWVARRRAFWTRKLLGLENGIAA